MVKKIDLFNKKGFLTAISKKIKEIYSENIFDFLFLTDDMNLLKTITVEIKYAAYSEEHSNHPIAQSIKKLYKEEIQQDKIKSTEDISGHGIISEIEDKK
jgi:cation transport ATPase